MNHGNYMLKIKQKNQYSNLDFIWYKQLIKNMMKMNQEYKLVKIVKFVIERHFMI